ncbi:MAG TPA: clostripain-related cysteine peptidase [Pyrinomonadaceae bacterium]|nr:clostripain-related cysteine peptidase [Pyrinomonadaceae bacterium]
MIYLAGENNLAEECIYALKEMKRAAPRPGPDGRLRGGNVDEQVKVVAQLDAGGLGGDESRYVLTRGDRDGFLNKDRVTKRDTSETTYRGVLKDFISSSITLGGLAEKYLLILSGHGDGVISDFLSRDADATNNLSIPKLKWVLGEVKQDLTEEFGRQEGDRFKIDVLGLDSCMMSMAEIGYELREYANYMVGAEGFEPNTGWPYERILTEILSEPGATTPKDLAVKIVEKYIAYYSDFLPAGRSVDQAACDLSKCDALAGAVRTLAAVLTEKLSDPESMRHIVLAHWEAQSYKDDQYVDLYDFCDLLHRGASGNAATGSVVMRDAAVDPHIVEACRAVKEVLQPEPGRGGAAAPEGMVLKSCFSGPAVQFSHGLSVYFPWSNVIDSYKDLDFAHDTNWNDFLLKYVDLTRRRRRPCPSDPEAETQKGELFFNPSLSGFDFLLTTNKDSPKVSRILSNKVGSMKNPALEYVPCDCEPNGDGGSASADELDADTTSLSSGTSQKRPSKRASKNGSKGASKATRKR